MNAVGRATPKGTLALKVIKGSRGPGLAWHLRNRLRLGYILGWISYHLAFWFTRLTGLPVMVGRLALVAVLKDGTKVDYGVVGYKVVTTAGVGFIVDAFQNSVELENMKYHAIGTGSTAEAVGETALVTELTTEYTPDNVRATGSTTENGANVYRTVGTNTMSGAGANLREHGVMSQAATGGGVLLDRTLFALITLADGDSLQSTYDLTLTAGS